MEVCVDSIQSAINAETGGATRIELCSSLNEGGLTPSIGMLQVVKKKLNIPVFVMIRPRPGDFIYSEEEIAVMRADIDAAKTNGADGIVFGILTWHGIKKIFGDGDINISKTEELIGISRPLPVTFHRAFDLTSNPIEALQLLMQLKCDRILTSGQQPTALAGIELISQLNEMAGKDLIVMPGGGIVPENLSEILHVTRAREFHGSASSSVSSSQKKLKSIFKLGLQSNEMSWRECNVDLVRQMVTISKHVWSYS